MDIKKKLLTAHDKATTEAIVAYVGSDPDRFAILAELFFSGEYRVTQRAAWSFSYCIRETPGLITPYFKRLLDNLDKPGHHVAVIRNTMRLLQDVEVPKRYQGRVMQAAFRFLEDVKTPVAVKAFSLTVLENLSSLYPDILPEIRVVVEAQWDRATPALRVRARRILRPD